MAVYYLQDCKLWVAQYDFTTRTNEMQLSNEVAELDVTNFGSGGWMESIAGLEKTGFDHKGHWEGGAGNIDDALFARLGATKVPATACPTTGADGEPAFFFEALHFTYEPGAAVGEVFAFSAAAKSTSKLIRGTVLLPKAARTASGDGTARQLGAVSATQKLYAALHVFTVSGTNPTLDVKVQSDAAEAFTTPADQITFAQVTAAGSQWATPVAGAITDDWYRINYTIAGTNPSFTFAVSVGIK